MPGMNFCVEELQRNKSRWTERIAEEQERVRHDSDDSTMLDGMFSPRSMSLATPSDATHQKSGSTMSSGRSNTDSSLRIKAMLSKSPFAQSKHFVDESAPLGHNSIPEISPIDWCAPESTDSPSPGQASPESANSRRSSKPSQLQLSYATSSAPGLQDENVVNGEPQTNGVEVVPSLVTDPVVADLSTPQESPAAKPETPERTSNTTESSNSARGDWVSQATSATTSKMPLSPSTQGTSIMSDGARDSLEKVHTPTGTSPPKLSNGSHFTKSTTTTTTSTSGGHDDAGLDGARDTDRPPASKGLLNTPPKLKKKPSRFRMNFWKRNKNSVSSIPGSEVDGEGRSNHS